MEISVTGHRAGFLAALVALPAAAVFSGVAVQQFSPEAPARDSHLVVVARDRGEVADDHDTFAGRAPFAQEAQDAVLGVVAINPLEAGRVTVLLVQGGLAAVAAVKVLHPAPQARVGGVVE